MDMNPSRANPTAEPERRRRRPPVSCSLCRRRKIRCNRQSPCSNCIRSKNTECVYESLSPPPARRANSGCVGDLERHRPVALDPSSTTGRGTTDPSLSSASIVSGSTVPSTPGSLPSTGEIELLRLKIKQLEEQLSKATQIVAASEASSPSFDTRTTNSHLTGAIHVRREHLGPGQTANTTSTIMHKGRFFGQTHWVHGAAEYLKMMETVEPLLLDETSKVRHDVQKSKYLSQKVKLRRTPPWPTLPTAEMPSKEVADSLVEIYLRTFESVRRVLHIPSFRRDYEALWASDDPPEMAFVVQLKLVLSLGAAMYDDNFSLLPAAVRWVREAQTWFSEPASKSRLTLQFLQINILLILARDVVGVSGTLVWISAGSLLRLAIFMGLHRDPSYLPGRKNTFTAEMHRRLWSTILEITLQTSLESGGPPLLSLDDFDTQPPGNFDDDQIMTEDAAPKPPEEFTQMSIALALRKLFPLRLAILRFLNSIDAHKSYNETLRLDSELRLSYKSICRALQASRSQSGKHPSQFQTHSLEWIVQQSFLALHVPFFTATMHETAFAFSRKVVIDSCIKAWCAIHPASSIMKSSLQADIAPTELQDMLRLVTCASGTVRYASMMICCLASAELKTQIQEEQLGPVLLRRDLLSILEDAKDWIWKCIGTSEMNFKGYMLLCMTCAHIDALVRGTPKELIPGVLLKAAEDSAARCLALFQEKAGVDESECGIDFEEMSALSGDNLPDVLMGDWWFSMPYVQPNFDVTDSMNWVYNGMASSTQMQSTRSGEQIW